MGRKSRIEEREIRFGKKLLFKSKVDAVYSEKVVASGNSARINCKSEFIDRTVLVVILSEKENLNYSRK